MQRGQSAAQAQHADVQEHRQPRIDDGAAPIDEADELDQASDSAAGIGLGNPGRARGALEEAESSLLVHLELYDRVGNQEGVAAAYGNLGLLYQALGDPAPAEAMYREALKVDEALGRKEAMAAVYRNLGRLYQTGGDAAQAAAMYRQSIALFEQVGAATRLRRVRQLLDTIPAARATMPARK